MLHNSQNLEEGFAIDSKFDLAISLEVAEHLSAESADGFVENICSLSDLILFSAAIPGQGGKNHINEQWQSYWANKFKNNGFNAYDFIRQRLWSRNDVQPYYRQNIILYCRAGSAEDRKLNNMTPAVTDCRKLDVVIPGIYLNRIKPRGINKVQMKGIASFFRKFFFKGSS